MNNLIRMGLFKSKEAPKSYEEQLAIDVERGELRSVITSVYYTDVLPGCSNARVSTVETDSLSMRDTVEYNLLPQGRFPKTKDDRILLNRKIAEVLKMVHLEGLSRYKLYTLGKKQLYRVAMAKALMSEPDVMVINDLFRYEESTLRSKMVFELSRLHIKYHLTMIYCTTEDWEALRISDRITVLNGDRIEQTDTPFTIYHNPNSCYVASRIDVNNIFDAYVHDVANGVATIYTESAEIKLHNSSVQEKSLIYVMIRPNKIVLQDHPSENINMSGILKGYLFAGAYYEARIQLGNGHIITAYTPDNQIEKGSKVYLNFKEEDCRLIPSVSEPIYEQIENLSRKVGNSLAVSAS